VRERRGKKKKIKEKTRWIPDFSGMTYGDSGMTYGRSENDPSEIKFHGASIWGSGEKISIG